MVSPLRLRTGDQTLVREINLSVIMNQLRTYAPISRATLAAKTGLNKTTVSSLVRELIEYNFVREVGYREPSLGRPAMLLELNPGVGDIVSAEIGVDFISVVRANFAAEYQWRHREQTDVSKGQHAIIERTLTLIHDAQRNDTATPGGLLGVALGVPGLVDSQTGNLLFAPNLGWRDVPLGDILRKTFRVPVYVDNEANLAALGEYYFGAARSYANTLYISAGVGLGGGIICDGALFRGCTGFAGELGHMTLVPDGLLCNCGNTGCWETVVSQAAVFRELRQAAERGEHTVLVEMTEGDLTRLTMAMVVDAAQAGDAVTLRGLESVGHYLGIGIASLVNVLNPQLVVLGGILSLAAKFLLPVVELELNRRALHWTATATKTVASQYGLDACVLGGVAMVYQTILSQPTTLAQAVG